MDRKALEAEVEELERRLDMARAGLVALRAKEDFGVSLGDVVKEVSGHEGQVLRIVFQPGYRKPWVWVKRRLAGDRWQNRVRCLTDQWEIIPPPD